MTQKTIVFDLGNVLVNWNPRNLYQKLIKDKKELDYFLSVVCPMSWHNHLDLGRPFAEVIAERQRNFPEYADLISAYDTRWEEMFDGAITPVVNILKNLHQQNYSLFALTNFPTEKFDQFCNDFPFMDCFQDVIVSGQEGIIKPDARIYDILLTRTGTMPENTVFIDDRLDNVMAARAKGIQALQYTEPDTLHHDLKELGITLSL